MQLKEKKIKSSQGYLFITGDNRSTIYSNGQFYSPHNTLSNCRNMDNEFHANHTIIIILCLSAIFPFPYCQQAVNGIVTGAILYIATAMPVSYNGISRSISETSVYSNKIILATRLSAKENLLSVQATMFAAKYKWNIHVLYI